MKLLNTTAVRVTTSVLNLAVALPLYSVALGLTVKYEMPGMAMLDAGGGLELQLHERLPTPSDAGVAISFRVDDVDTSTHAAIDAGTLLIKGPQDEPWGERQSVLHDPDGHVFCLVQPL